MNIKMRKLFKRVTSFLLTIFLLFSSVPLSGFVGLDFSALPDFPEFEKTDFYLPDIDINNLSLSFDLPEFNILKKSLNSVSDLFRDLRNGFTMKAKAASLPEFNQNQLIASFLANTYTGPSIYAGTKTAPAYSLDYYSSATSNYNSCNPTKILVDSIEKNSNFLEAVGLWKVATFEPSDLVEEPLLNQEDFYKAIIFKVLDISLSSEEIFSSRVERATTQTTKLLNDILDIIEDAEGVTKAASDTPIETLAYGTLDFIFKCLGAQNDTLPGDIKLFCSALDDTITVANFVEEVVKYIQLSQLSEDVKTALYNLYLYSVQLYGDGHPMSNALYDAYMVCSDAFNAYITALETGGELIKNKSIGTVLNNAWSSVIGFVGAEWLLLGQSIGTSIANFCFSADALIDQYFIMSAMVKFEQTVAFATRQVRSQYVNNPTLSNACRLIGMADLLFSTRKASCDYAKEFADIAFTEGLVAKISGGGRNDTYNSFIDYADNIQWSIEYARNEALDIEFYKPYIEADYPEIYWELFGEEPSTEKTTTNIKISTTPDSCIYTFEYIVNDDGTTARIVDYSGYNVDSIVIPSKIDGFTITELSDGLFYACTSLRSVSIPQTVSVLGERVFMLCTALESLVLPEAVTCIPDEAFFGCSSLKSVNIPKNVSSLGKATFKKCSSLESIVIPELITYIPKEAFYGCSGLKELTMAASVYLSNDWAAFTECSNIQTITLTKGSGYIRNFGEYNEYNEEELYYHYCTPWYISNGCEVIIEEGVTQIGYASFRYANIIKITIPTTIASIGYEAFAGCDRLEEVWFTGSVEDWVSINYDCKSPSKDWLSEKSSPLYNADKLYIDGKLIEGAVVIPEGITTIGEYAFYNMDSITDIVFPDSLKIIGYYAFYDCDNIISLVVPDRASVFPYAFYGCGFRTLKISANLTTDGFGDNYNLETIILTNSNGEMRDYSLFEEYYYKDYYYCNTAWYNNRLRVKNIILEDGITNISSMAFKDCYSMESITIPDSVNTIGAEAFSGCYSLKSISISDSVSSIGNSAFSGCYGLTSVEIPDSVTVINESTFSGCYGLKNVTIPDSVTSIGDLAFSGCYGLTNVTIRNSVTSIGYSAFSGCYGLKDITIPDSVTVINESTFSGCYGLTNVTIPNSVTSIGYSAFSGCYGLKDITIPDSVTVINESTFSGCYGLTNVKIPNSVTTISDSAFSGCYGLTSVEIPYSVTYIGRAAFYNCSGLKELTMPVSAKIYNSNSTFGGCINIEKVTLTKGTGTMKSYSSNTGKSDTFYQYTPWYISGCDTVVIEPGITNIGSFAFYNCTELTNVIIPDNVTTIGSSAFESCSNLTSVTMPDSITTIGRSAFEACSSLTSITIPDGVTSINKYTFYNCSRLQELSLPVSAKIYEYAFDGCTGIEKITLTKGNGTNYSITTGDYSDTTCYLFTPWYISGCSTVVIDDGVKSIGEYTFYKCSGLSDVTISDTVTSIAKYAFYGCINLDNLTIPDSVTSINDYSFYNCSGMKELSLPVSANIYNSPNTFGNCTNIEKITLSKGTGTMLGYATDTPESYGTLYTNTPWYISGCKTVVIAEGVKNIGSNAFRACSFLETVSLPDSLTSIDSYAFNSCTKLKNINLPNNLTQIGSYAFYGCKGLRELIIPDGISAINNHTFFRCTNLNSVTLPERLDSVGVHAFYDCKNLETVYFKGNVNQWKEISVSDINTSLLNATIYYQYTEPYNHSGAWSVTTDPTATLPGQKAKVCTDCGVVFATKNLSSTGFEATNGMIVDYANNIVYGLSAGVDSLNSFTNVVTDGAEWEYIENKNGFGTGTKAILKSGNEIIGEYTIVIFGDVQGDGWYDGEDAFLVNLIAKGMLSKDDVGEAIWTAADCNHDGVIDETDVDLLTGAGLLLNKVDQSATAAELATNSDYIEYVMLIDQSAGMNLGITPDVNDAQLSTTTPDTNGTVDSDEPATENNIDFEVIFTNILELFKKIFAFVFSFMIK